jgi:PAS domain-containing protein
MPALDFRALFERSPNPYMVLDRALRFVAANPAYLRVTSSRLEDLLGRHVLDLFPNDPANPANESARQLRESLERVLATGQPDSIALISYRVPTRIGEAGALAERYWSATHTPIFDEAGKVAFILQHTMDVSELEQRDVPTREQTPPVQLGARVLSRARDVQEANRTLDSELRRLRSLFAQAPGFVAFLRGKDHVFELANHAYLQVVGHRDILGRPVREAIPEVRGQGFYELLDQVFESGKASAARG